MALHMALTAKDKLAANLYYCALMALSQNQNPCRFIIAGHLIRELIDGLPRFLDCSQPKKPEEVKDMVNNLRAVWCRCNASKQENWDKTVNNALVKFIKEAKKFFDWYERECPDRRERNVNLVRNLDPSEHRLPSQLEQMRADEWRDYQHYFCGVLHLGDPREFEQRLDALEICLIDALVPRTFEEFDQIDKLLSGVEE